MPEGETPEISRSRREARTRVAARRPGPWAKARVEGGGQARSTLHCPPRAPGRLLAPLARRASRGSIGARECEPQLALPAAVRPRGASPLLACQERGPESTLDPNA